METSCYNTDNDSKLSKSTLALIERKRQNAILLRESRLQNKDIPSSHSNPNNKSTLESNPYPSKKRKTITDDLFTDVRCMECSIKCNASYLYEKFKENVCDECKEKDKDQFKLITKTEAKNEFVLKDCDLDYREPPLMYITAPNPHSRKGGIMKLYLHGQVYKRAFDVHGGDEGIDEALAKRLKNKEITMENKMNKKLADLRRGSKPRQLKQAHVHDFGDEIFDSVTDEYSRSCKSCSYIEKYEKL